MALSEDGSHPLVASNTIVRNTVGVRVDGRVLTSKQTYANNIIVDNGIGLQVEFLEPGGEPVWGNSLVFNNQPTYARIADFGSMLTNHWEPLHPLGRG